MSNTKDDDPTYKKLFTDAFFRKAVLGQRACPSVQTGGSLSNDEVYNASLQLF